MLANARSCSLAATTFPRKMNGKEQLETDTKIEIGLKITTYNS
jgi:hypothetical protein